MSLLMATLQIVAIIAAATTGNVVVVVQGVEVGNFVTPAFFNGIINQAAATCPGKTFYTRDSFFAALRSYPQFGKTGVADNSKREIAAFFAHVTHETGFLCHITENQATRANSNYYCDPSFTRYPCARGKQYYGRGPLQLSWNYNYGAAGKANGFDGLNAPDTVAQNNVVSFKVALWFWKTTVRPVLNQGFGATIKAINSGECNSGNSGAVQARIRYYRDYCKKFGVSPGGNLSC
ncbi:hypothetical protein OROGR_021570 [Orobanche gracilis]